MGATNWSSRRFAFCAVLVSLLILTSTALYGQVDTGAILGTVKDQSGAVIPGATVTLTIRGREFPERKKRAPTERTSSGR